MSTKWCLVKTNQAPENLPVRIYHPDWVDEFTPTGTTEGILLGDGEGNAEWIGAFWDNDEDRWITIERVPTHWSFIEEVDI